MMPSIQDNDSLSVYIGELKQETVVRNVARIKAAFPALPPEFYKLFIERVKDKGFSDQRLIDAVNNVIDTCQYPTPTLANFLSFDRRVKIFDYRQVVSMVTKQEAKFDDFSKVKVGGTVMYVRNSVKIMFKIPDEL